MQLPSETYRYLSGQEYTNALAVSFEFDKEDSKYSTQADLLCHLSQKKRVVHVGCVDHNIETIDHKFKRKKWLHARLCKSAQRCHGIDINEDGIRYIREKLGYNDTSTCDISSDEFMALVEGDNWDYLLIPEVLEHTDDPIGFLRTIAERYSGQFKKIIITVPNGLSHDNLKWARKNTECINSDHRFWFTPYTLAKCIITAGLHVDEIRMCRHGSINWRALRRNRFYRKHPLLRNDILCIATFSQKRLDG